MKTTTILSIAFLCLLAACKSKVEPIPENQNFIRTNGSTQKTKIDSVACSNVGDGRLSAYIYYGPKINKVYTNILFLIDLNTGENKLPDAFSVENARPRPVILPPYPVAFYITDLSNDSKPVHQSGFYSTSGSVMLSGNTVTAGSLELYKIISNTNGTISKGTKFTIDEVSCGCP